MKKKKLKSYKILKAKLDTVFSMFIRLRDTEGGAGQCITCSKRLTYEQGQAGHWISRSYLSTRWDERNVHLQCPADNLYRKGAPAEYAVALVQKYGEGILQELVDLKRETRKFSRTELQDKINHYETLINQLKLF